MTAVDTSHFAPQLIAFVSGQLGVSPSEIPDESRWCGSGSSIGTLCLRLGALDFSEVEETLVAQESSRELFGDAAIRLGFLTAETRESVLELQQAHRALDLGSLLVLEGRLELAALLEMLQRFFSRSSVQASNTPLLHVVSERRAFGLHLVERGRISQSQLASALDHQRAERVSIGRLAYEGGIMTLDQMVEVLNLQPSRGQRYGEIAVAMGYMSEKQRDDLLAQQEDAMAPIGQVLVQLGALSAVVLERELLSYREGARQAEG